MWPTVSARPDDNAAQDSTGRVVAVVPARLTSSRFPEKVIAADTGRPLVQHVVDRVRLCGSVDEVVVAADSPRIADALRPFATRVVMTDADHPSGTDRVAQAARDLGLGDDDLILNVQGDEPEIEPSSLDALVSLMRKSGADMGTLAAPFPEDADPTDPADPNLVKVVLAPDGRALYFSRAPIPFDRDKQGVRPLLHVGVYAYRATFLQKLATYAPTPLEQAERLEQLRVLERGHTIHAAVVPRPTHGVDTPQQYAAFVNRYKSQHPEP